MDTIESAKMMVRQVSTSLVCSDPSSNPLITFVALMQLMDNFRVFEPIVGFS